MIEPKLKDFIKNLKILYVEDEKDAKEKLTKILKKIFNQVDTSENGVDAYIKFQDNFETKSPYDLIITDINMPKMNGIEFIKKVKEKDKELPIIFTTARNESDILLEAINLNINLFLLKPIDLSILYENIQNIAQKIYQDNQFLLKQNELKTYTKIIENVAIISKTDEKGIITYVDEAFCEITGFTKEELLGKDHSIIRHPDNPKEIYENLWNVIQKGQVWEGKVRNIDKNGEIWYAKSTIFPIFDENNNKIKEYVAIRFLINEEHNEKRELNSKLIKSTVLHKKEFAALEKQKIELENHIILQNEIILNLQEKNTKFQATKNKLLSQITEYEHSGINTQNDKLTLLKKKNDEIQSISKTLALVKEERDNQQKRIREMENENEIKASLIESYKKNITQYKVQLGQLKRTNEDSKEEKKKGFFG